MDVDSEDARLGAKEAGRRLVKVVSKFRVWVEQDSRSMTSAEVWQEFCRFLDKYLISGLVAQRTQTLCDIHALETYSKPQFKMLRDNLKDVLLDLQRHVLSSRTVVC